MIREFWVENYLSIRNRQILNFETEVSDENWLSAEISKDINLNRVGIFFGANASGKSNMLKAMLNVFELMFIDRKDRNERVYSEMPFALTKALPTQLFVSFFADGIRYDYKISYLLSHIIKEELYYYPNKSKSLFYERNYVGDDNQCDIRFGTSVGVKTKTLRVIKENTLNNHSVLSTYGKVALTEDAYKIANLYNWIKYHVHGVNKNVDDLVSLLREVSEEPKKKRFFIEMLKKADFNISNFNVLSDSTGTHIEFVNTTDDGNFMLPMATQSAGTIKYLIDLNYLYDAITGDHIYMLDELGEDLHYDLLLYYIRVFLANSQQSQLFFTTQEMTLLSEDQFNENRQSVWFAEKLSVTAASEYTRADQLGLRKDHSLYNSYRIGRFGAKPALGSPFILNQD